MKCDNTLKHSSKLKLFLRFLPTIIAVILLSVMVPAESMGQMFSVGEKEPQFNSPNTNFFLGVEAMDVSYQGLRSIDNSAGQFEFAGPIIKVGYRNQFVNLHLSTGGPVSGIEYVGYFEVGGALNVLIDLYQSETISLFLPIHISSRLVNMTNSKNFYPRFNNFRFGNLSGGLGPKVLIRPAEKIRIDVRGIPTYGFAFASRGSQGGSFGSVDLQGRLYFDRLFGDVGLSVGYQYDLRNYDIDEDVYDYKIKGHIFELGITF
ncbi:hypothetical protein [Fodinibius saliphilus]|uniref:hypothetical protein n=1 Tax=Fodinibius saliphilus TaxID=1920650 RepID=UPI00110893F8|nr:hypothetical protein [Fodinibius saliphilus]